MCCRTDMHSGVPVHVPGLPIGEQLTAQVYQQSLSRSVLLSLSPPLPFCLVLDIYCVSYLFSMWHCTICIHIHVVLFCFFSFLSCATLSPFISLISHLSSLSSLTSHLSSLSPLISHLSSLSSLSSLSPLISHLSSLISLISHLSYLISHLSHLSHLSSLISHLSSLSSLISHLSSLISQLSPLISLTSHLSHLSSLISLAYSHCRHRGVGAATQEVEI